MNQGKRWTVVLMVALLGLLLTGVAWAQVSPNYDLSWHVLAGGGQDMASPNHQARSTLGQFAIGRFSSVDHALGSGYWYGVRAPGYGLYLPLIVKTAEP